MRNGPSSAKNLHLHQSSHGGGVRRSPLVYNNSNNSNNSGGVGSDPVAAASRVLLLSAAPPTVTQTVFLPQAAHHVTHALPSSPQRHALQHSPSVAAPHQLYMLNYAASSQRYASTPPSYPQQQ